MKKEYHKRNRLENYDYSNKGVYFLTLCTANRKQRLSCVVARGILDAPAVELSSDGKIVHSAISFLDENWEDILVLSYVIMPNHVHILVRVLSASGMPRATDAMIPKFVSSLKRYTQSSERKNALAKKLLRPCDTRRADYIIRLSYIENNPAKWMEDEYYTQEEPL